MENKTNFQRTAQWLASAGKTPGNAQDISAQISCFIEEIVEALELIECGEDMETGLHYLERAYKALRSGETQAMVHHDDRAEFIKELCDVEVTLNGVAFLLEMDKDGADKAVLDSNDDKFVDGKPVILPGGKIGKRDGWKKPWMNAYV